MRCYYALKFRVNGRRSLGRVLRGLCLIPKSSGFPVAPRPLARRVRFPAIVHLPIVHAGGHLATLRQPLQNGVDRSQRIGVGVQIESSLGQHLADGDRRSGLSAIRPENLAHRIGEPRRVGHQLLQLQKLLRLLLVGEKIRIGNDELGDPLDLQSDLRTLRTESVNPGGSATNCSNCKSCSAFCSSGRKFALAMMSSETRSISRLSFSRFATSLRSRKLPSRMVARYRLNRSLIAIRSEERRVAKEGIYR